MHFIVKWNGSIVGVFHDIIDALAMMDPTDGHGYTLVVVEKADIDTQTEFVTKTIQIAVVGEEY